MKTTGRSAALALLLALVLTACTGDEGGSTGPTGATTGNTGATGPTAPTAPISVPPGSSVYRYANAGLVATIDFDTGTLEVDNGTGRDLPKPSFYVLDARDGGQVDGTVKGSAPVPAGDTATFEVALDGIELRNIGLVVLIMGSDNYGAFVQQ